MTWTQFTFVIVGILQLQSCYGSISEKTKLMNAVLGKRVRIDSPSLTKDRKNGGQTLTELGFWISNTQCFF